MAQIIELLTFLFQKGKTVWLHPSTLASVAGILAALVITMIVKRHSVRDLVRGNLATDGTYALFYLSGLYYVVVGGPVYGVINHLVAHHIPWLQVGVALHFPPVVHFILLTLALDFSAYWWHRTAHAVPFLWRFHKIHHSQVRITPLTNFRFHFVDVLSRSVLMMLPAFLLGTSTELWLTVIFIETALDGLAHSDVGWTYGWFGFLFVSPQFHRFHHSSDPQHFGHNFAQQYSLWDRLFGTALTVEGAPSSYGVPDPVPNGFVRQTFYPFLALRGRRSSRPTGDVLGAEAATR